MIKKGATKRAIEHFQYNCSNWDDDIQSFIKETLREDEQFFRLVFGRNLKKATSEFDDVLNVELSEEEKEELNTWLDSIKMTFGDLPEGMRHHIYDKAINIGCFSGKSFRYICDTHSLLPKSVVLRDKDCESFEYYVVYEDKIGNFIRKCNSSKILLEWINSKFSGLPKFIDDEVSLFLKTLGQNNSQMYELFSSNRKCLIDNGKFRLIEQVKQKKNNNSKQNTAEQHADDSETAASSDDPQINDADLIVVYEKLFDNCVYPKDVLGQIDKMLLDIKDIPSGFVDSYSSFLYSLHSEEEIMVAFHFKDTKRLRKYRGVITKRQSGYLYWCARKWCDAKPGLEQLSDGSWWELYYWWML